jgi:hypothetical protein
MAGPWYNINSHDYTTVAGAPLKRYECLSLHNVLSRIHFSITLHYIYYTSGASRDADIALSARNEIMLTHLLLLTDLKFLIKEPWFPIRHQAFKQLREYLLSLSRISTSPRKSGTQGLILL